MSIRRIFLRRSSASEWASENPILSLGEPGFDYTNEILKIGNGVDQWSALAQFQGPQGVAGVDGNDGANGADGQDGVQISSYTKANLPLAATAGTNALVTDGTIGGTPTMSYFYNGIWYRTFDNSQIVDQTIDIYLLAGQSNAIGQGVVSELTQSQVTSNGLFYSSDHYNKNDALTFQNYDNSWATEIKAGFTRGNDATRFGPEIGFSNHTETQATRPFGILKYAVGSSALTSTYNPNNTGVNFGNSDWDINPSATGQDGDCWRGFKRAISDGVTKLTAQGYHYRIAGLIWWQGESGGNANELKAFISAVRSYVKSNYLTDVIEARLPVVIAGTNASTWGLDFETGVAFPDAYVGFVDTHQSSGLQNGNVHPGSGNNNLQTDGSGSGNNDMYDIGVKFAEKMVLARGGLTATGSLAWTPSGLSPTIWFDADDASTITTSGSSVTAWNDKSGNNDHPTTLTNVTQSGTIGGKNTMTFGTTSIMTGGSSNWAWQEVFVVAEYTGSSTFHSSYSGLFTGGTRYQIILLGHAGNSHWYAFTVAGMNQYNVNGSLSAWSGQNNTNIINELSGGGLVGLNSNSATNLDGWTIGQQSDFNDRGWVGKIAEVLTFSSALSSSDREKVEGYLAHKWGFTSKLPTNHTYRVTAP